MNTPMLIMCYSAQRELTLVSSSLCWALARTSDGPHLSEALRLARTIADTTAEMRPMGVDDVDYLRWRMLDLRMEVASWIVRRPLVSRPHRAVLYDRLAEMSRILARPTRVVAW